MSAILEVWTVIPGLALLVAGGLGALLAMRPTRLAAWLAVVQGGFALLGLSTGGPAGPGVAILVVVTMAASVLGIGLLARRAGSPRALSGLPSVLVGLFLLSLAGVPPTGGAAARLRVLMALVEAGFPVLALLAAGLSLLSLAAVVRGLVSPAESGVEGKAPGRLAVGVALALAIALAGASVLG